MSEKKATRGRPRGSRNRKDERLSKARLKELMDGSVPRNLAERTFCRHYFKMTPAERVKQRLSLEPKERAAPSVEPVSVKLVVTGLMQRCERCGHVNESQGIDVEPIDAEKPFPAEEAQTYPDGKRMPSTYTPEHSKEITEMKEETDEEKEQRELERRWNEEVQRLREEADAIPPWRKPF